MQEVVDATLLEEMKTSIERNTSLQMLDIYIKHSRMVEAIFKGARGNTSLKKLTIWLFWLSDQLQDHLKAAAAELQQVRPQLELNVISRLL